MPETHKEAIILMAYGSPNSLDEVGDFLSQIKGRKPAPEEIYHLKEKYLQVGGRTPLLQIT
ncbi:MAG TPA: ferrochelatase, partial [Candidatus Bathyarchaeia archaeon]|nr:ferrochelatase [Candidatus Bathyarchaeia archaeon]